jgi:lipopolysaccharide export LptBFGC system permease protein LptF
MGRAERYFWWKAMRALAVATPGFIAVMTLSHAGPIFELFSRRVIDVGEVFYLLLLWVPMMIYLAMPMIVALAIGCSYAAAMQDRELVIMHAVGMSAGRLAVPGVMAATAAALLCASMSLYTLPEAFREFRDRVFLAEKNLGPQALRENQFNEVRPGIDVYFERHLPGGAVRNVAVFLREDGALVAITAKLGTFTRIDGRFRVVFHDGYITKSSPGDVPGTEPSVVHFQSFVQDLARDYSIQDMAERGVGFFERHVPALVSPAAAERLAPDERAAWVAEGYKRILHPILCLAYGLAAVAVALGAGFGRRTTLADIALRVMAFLLAVHPAYLVGIGVLGREPGIDARIMFAYPVAVVAAAAWFILRLDRGHGRRTAHGSGLGALDPAAHRRVATG